MTGRLTAVLIIWCQVWLAPAWSGEKTFGDVEITRLINVIDGDSFNADIDEFHPLIGDTIGVRINGIDTPELRGKSAYERELAQKARLYSEKRLQTAEKIVLKNMRRDKYFRILADVYVDKYNLGKELIRVGLAVPYSGGKKHVW